LPSGKASPFRVDIAAAGYSLFDFKHLVFPHFDNPLQRTSRIPLGDATNKRSGNVQPDVDRD
jgi:hypothetical protein